MGIGKAASAAAAVAIAMLSQLVQPRPAGAIPVFAYIYGKPCSACHTVFPQLNPEGERFRWRGLHGLEPVVQPIAIGRDFALPGTLPVAVTAGIGEDLTGKLHPKQDNSLNEHFNLEYLGVLGGAELGPHLAFLADYAALFGSPTTGETKENHKLGLGFLQAHAEPWGWLGNLKVGLQELPLGTSPRVHRLSNQGYLIYQVTPASLLAARAPVTGVRKDTLNLSSTQYSVELSALEPDADSAFWLGGSLGSNNKDDFNSSQDFFTRVQHNFGSGREHSAGLFLYYSPDALGTGVHDQALRVGPDLTLYWRRSRVVAQFLAGWDSNPTGHQVDFWYYGGFVEGNYRLTPRWVTLARIDAVGAPRFDDTSQGGQVDYQPRLWAATAGIQYLLDENLKLLVEGSYGAMGTGVATESYGPPGAPGSTSTTSRIAPESWIVTFQLRTAFFPLRPPFYGWLFGNRSGGASS
jgi:hypothetical protein